MVNQKLSSILRKQALLNSQSLKGHRLSDYRPPAVLSSFRHLFKVQNVNNGIFVFFRLSSMWHNWKGKTVKENRKVRQRFNRCCPQFYCPWPSILVSMTLWAVFSDTSSDEHTRHTQVTDNGMCFFFITPDSLFWGDDKSRKRGLAAIKAWSLCSK